MVFCVRRHRILGPVAPTLVWTKRVADGRSRDVSDIAARPASSKRRRGLLLASNVLLVAAIALIAYPFVTDYLSGLHQRSMATNAELPGPTTPVVTLPGGDPFDWQGWETQDKAYWTKLRSGGVFGRLVIPRIRLDTVVVKGATMENLQRGPVFNEISSFPGPTGRTTFHGHRVTWLHPFKNVDKLKAGDEFTFYSPYRRYTYRVRRLIIVRPEKLLEVMRDTTKPSIILTACHPWYSKRFRIVVEADLVGAAPLRRSQ
jgi:LPXTG-site transpeptidase (sortase) family protein